MAGFFEQLGVRSDFFDPALVHDHDLIGRKNGGEPMGDGDDRAAGGEPLERALNLLFRFRIERRSRFIEQKDRRVLQERARNGEPLLLAAGKQTSLCRR